MKNTIKILAFGAALASMVSCDLNLTPIGSIVYNPGDPIITNQEDLIGFEAGVMSSFRALEYGAFDMTSDVMVDYFNATSDFGNNGGPIHRTDNSFGANDEYVASQWATCYSSINNFNIVINGAQPEQVLEELRADAAIMRGEAYAGRAYAYMHLARHFGKAYSDATAADDLCVPIVTEYDQIARPARNTVAEVYDLICQDLDSAAVLLANVEGQARAQRPTIDFVNAMYARYYLDIQDYENAAASAMAVIETGNYGLANTADLMVAEWQDDEGYEPILQFYADISEGTGGHAWYTQANSDDKIGQCLIPYFLPAKKIVTAYDAADLRFATWFTNEYPIKLNAGYYNVEGEPEVYAMVKYLSMKYSSSSIPSSGLARKPIMIGEMLLIAAEAFCQMGDDVNATGALQTLQSARGAVPTAGTMENIKKEWFRETVGEGLRMSCLKRWNEGFNGREAQDGVADYGIINIVGDSYDKKALPAGDYHYQWPIPYWDMQTNPNLVQNEGYTAAEI